MLKTGGNASILSGGCTTMDMFRRRRRRVMSSPVVSQKHQHSQNQSYIGTSANLEFLIVEVGLQGIATSPSKVQNGTKIYNIFVSVSAIRDSSTDGSTYSWMLVKLRNGQTIDDIAAVDASNWSNVGNSMIKNQIFHTEMGIFGTEDAGSVRYNRIIKIPKIYQRQREGDSFVLVFNSLEPAVVSLGARFKSFN